ncbi:hypothetical protein PGT21_015331 [Puccinia graminis f. sp. tritici]|uniref:Uncharacterized protein n=1 Tax=Puccinia graminis f. sp. tritici TaxID=56615 RepID=A0A5B0R0U4_PUCGR|nr:hypothetical protein PGT21_015331 [Puccinia graminis f. sp. tritici]
MQTRIDNAHIHRSRVLPKAQSKRLGSKSPSRSASFRPSIQGYYTSIYMQNHTSPSTANQQRERLGPDLNQRTVSPSQTARAADEWDLTISDPLCSPLSFKPSTLELKIFICLHTSPDWPSLSPNEFDCTPFHRVLSSLLLPIQPLLESLSPIVVGTKPKIKAHYYLSLLGSHHIAIKLLLDDESDQDLHPTTTPDGSDLSG